MKKVHKIGILGGGQLARMSAYQAYKLGLSVVILDKEFNSPAGQLTKEEFTGWVADEDVLKKFTDASDIVTLENEFIDFKILEKIESYGKKVIPDPYTISLIQDKLTQKDTLAKFGIPVPAYVKISAENSYSDISEKLGKKFILKSRKLGYDGYGNFSVCSESDFIAGMEKLTLRHNEIMAESFIRFKMELAVMAVRTPKEVLIYPIVETIQKNHICHLVIAPADVSTKIKRQASEIAAECVKAVGGYGLYGIEFFLTDDYKILVNEMAPRPHNSGHYTIEGCRTSQFENHIRSIIGLPLGSAEMTNKYAVMLNILGKKDAPGKIENYNKVLASEGVHFHWYGKKESRPGRKMGHLTMTGKDKDEIIRILKKAEKNILI